MENIFEFLEREFHCEYFMFYKFVDIISGSWGNEKAALASLWRHFKMATNSKKQQNGSNSKKWPSTSSLIAPTILELEKTLLNKIFCSKCCLKTFL